jgi:hypothetical protein
MPTFEDVNVMEMDRATSRLEEVRENPTRTFLHVPLDATGRPCGSHGIYHWQNGHWFDTGFNWIADPDQTVPQRFRDEIAADRPMGRIKDGPQVTWSCPYCQETMNFSQSNLHLVTHMNEMLEAAGRIAPADVIAKPTTTTTTTTNPPTPKPEKPDKAARV